MCGIAGKLNFDPSQPVDNRVVLRMTRVLAHRGPDDEGVYCDGNVGLGHRRLSIIDLSPQGHQPMSNEDGSVWITFNGEVYNFQELRPGLGRRGHRFRSQTDTEVVLHLYEDYGADCVKHLRGMFAFAIWDKKARLLLLARDRLGVKPLYYALTSSGILFASEIKGILASGDVVPEPDAASIHSFLTWQCVPSPHTGFRGVRKLPPGCLLVCRGQDDLQVERYWQLTCEPTQDSDEQALTAQVRALAEEATRLRLIADVPLGVYLSGGLDSSCVLAAMRRVSSGKIRTFSIRFPERSFDESEYARTVARHFETDHHEFEIRPNAVDVLPHLVDLFDEPFADVAAIPTYYLALMTRQHVTVALSGDGGDENFGGYQRYFALKLLRAVSRLGANHLIRRLSALVPYSHQERSRLRYFRELLSLSGKSAEEQYSMIMMGMFPPEGWRAIYSNDFLQSLDGTDPLEGFRKGWGTSGVSNDLARAMAADIAFYIPECLNLKVDISSMAHALEVRSPFLDHRLIEFCARIPTGLKIRGSHQKHILKRAFAKELPRAVLRRSKAGFSMPLAEWFRGELRELASDILLSARCRARGVFESSKVERMLQEHLNGEHNWHIQLWRILILELWYRSLIDNDLYAHPRLS